MLIEPQLKVLVAEDNPTNVAVLTGMLEAFGCKICFAVNGQQAVTSAKSCAPDVILMDINMPVQDGVDAAISLRREMPDPHVPIVAVTGNVTPRTRQRCQDARFDGFIEKPVNISVLHQTLKEIADLR